MNLTTVWIWPSMFVFVSYTFTYTYTLSEVQSMASFFLVQNFPTLFRADLSIFNSKGCVIQTEPIKGPNTHRLPYVPNGVSNGRQK